MPKAFVSSQHTYLKRTIEATFCLFLSFPKRNGRRVMIKKLWALNPAPDGFSSFICCNNCICCIMIALIVCWFFWLFDLYYCFKCCSLCLCILQEQCSSWGWNQQNRKQKKCKTNVTHVILSKNSATLKESDKDPFEITWIRNTAVQAPANL